MCVCVCVKKRNESPPNDACVCVCVCVCVSPSPPPPGSIGTVHCRHLLPACLRVCVRARCLKPTAITATTPQVPPSELAAEAAARLGVKPLPGSLEECLKLLQVERGKGAAWGGVGWVVITSPN